MNPYAWRKSLLWPTLENEFKARRRRCDGQSCPRAQRLLAKDLVEDPIIADSDSISISLPLSFTAPRGNGSSRSSLSLSTILDLVDCSSEESSRLALFESLTSYFKSASSLLLEGPLTFLGRGPGAPPLSPRSRPSLGRNQKPSPRKTPSS